MKVAEIQTVMWRIIKKMEYVSLPQIQEINS